MGVPPCPVGVTMWVPISLQKMAEVVMALCMIQCVVGRGPLGGGVDLVVGSCRGGVFLICMTL